MILTRDDVERITENLLNQLTISVRDEDDLNLKTVELRYRGQLISSCNMEFKKPRKYIDD